MELPWTGTRGLGRGDPGRVRGWTVYSWVQRQMGRVLEQLWRLRRCRAGTRGLLPDFSHAIPTATFVILSSPSTFPCRASVRTFCLSSPSHPPPLTFRSPLRCPFLRECAHQPVHNDPRPWPLTHVTLLYLPQTATFSLHFLFFNTCSSSVSPART